MIDINFIIIFVRLNNKSKFSAIVYRTIMIIIYLIRMFIIFHLSLFFSQILDQ